MSLNKIKASSTWTLCLILLMAGGSVMAGVDASHPGNSADGTFTSTPNPDARGTNVTNQNTATDYADLATAVAAATAGDTLVINASFAEGTVNIDKNLTITGSGQTISAAGSTGNSGDARGWFLVDSGVNLIVSGVNFDGSGQSIFQAFRHKGTGSFTDCGFSNIEYDTGGGTTTGFAIVSFDEGATASLSVDNCSFSSYGKSGVFAFGDTTVTIVDSDFTGGGASTGTNVQYGAEAGGGADLDVSDSIFVDHSDNEGTAESAGILGTTAFDPGTTVTSTSNWFQNNLNGILTSNDVADTTNVTSSYDSLISNGEGISMGPSASGTAENNWWGCNAGPGNTGCDSSSMAPSNWLVMTVSIDDVEILWSETAELTVSLRINNDDVDTSGSGTVIDGLPVTFDGGGSGSVEPDPMLTVDGIATGTFTPAPVQGDGELEVTLGNQTFVIPITTAVTTVPTLGEYGMMAFIGLLAFAGMVMMRRNRVA